MSGVAKDETSSPSTQDETAAAAPEGVSAPEGSTSATEADEKLPELHIPELRSQDHKADHKGRRASHLRVVAANETAGETGSPEPAAQRIGSVMRAQRQHLGYDLDAVSKETRIAVSHLRAIEDMTPNVIGQPVYVKGHIRTYARHLKMDPDAVLSQYKDECALLADPEKQDIAPPVSTRKLPVAIPAFGLLIVALVGAGGVYAVMQANGGKSPSAKAATHSTYPASAAAVDASTVPVAPPLHIVAIKEARIEVRGADGTKFLARSFAPGESYSPRVGAGWTVTTSDGSAFEWRLGDQSLGLLAPEGPVYAQSVDLAMKREPVAPPVVPDAEPTVPSPLDANARVPATTAATNAAVHAAGPAAARPPASRPASAAPAGTPTVAALPKPKPKASAPTAAPAAAQAHAGPPQIGTAPVPTSASAANPTPATDPSLLAYPPS
jgi:cytoskeletal protein RodZ